jgi:hypothetical protein
MKQIYGVEFKRDVYMVPDGKSAVKYSELSYGLYGEPCFIKGKNIITQEQKDMLDKSGVEYSIMMGMDKKRFYEYAKRMIKQAKK